MADNSSRPILPQTSQAGSFSFAAPNMGPRENQRNYVFVDEHNRHKRLKVMRACEGCRRRKIKCDAATTNSWPCAACVRLKLTCVPPQVTYEQDFASAGSHTFDLDTQGYTDAYHTHEDFRGLPADLEGDGFDQSGLSNFAGDAHLYTTSAPYNMSLPSTHGGLGYVTLPDQLTPGTTVSNPNLFDNTGMASLPASSEADTASWQPEVDAADLADVMGELKIGHTAIAPYIMNQKKTLAEAPALQEQEVRLPQYTSSDMTVRIPYEMMPSDQQALTYFDYFFDNIHPYMPVMNRPYFYQQWQSNRESISPLVLEAIFACTTLSMKDVQQGNKWLALASKHEESFKDVPRLSTMQATLLLMKARESVPKRGYFYRSWMTIVNLIAMGKDLELDEHHEQHELGGSCGSSVLDCITKTRVWHTLYVLEIMVGGPQGRYKFVVQDDSVNLELPESMPGLDEGELRISRQYTYLMRVTQQIRRSNWFMYKFRNKKGWAMDPEYQKHNDVISSVLTSFPSDLQIAYPADDSAPWISSHFVANLHTFYQLCIIMHYRPQLHHHLDNGDPRWKDTMEICYTAAKKMCKIQEGVIEGFGFTGMLFMLRGLSFAIYAILTSTMLHLIAVTAPDPTMSANGRIFFTRHMRILEQVAEAWPMPEMKAQVDALREAFSADTSKPFDLKPSFPYGSPVLGTSPNPLSTVGMPTFPTSGPLAQGLGQTGQVNYKAHHPITPPFTAADARSKTDSPPAQSMVMMASGQGPNSLQAVDQSQWNPGRILDQWNAAFGTPPPSAHQETSPPLLNTPLSSGSNMNNMQASPFDEHQQQHDLSAFAQQTTAGLSPQSLPGLQMSPMPSTDSTNTATAASSIVTDPASFVTPSMWQNVVAESLGIKRRYGEFES